MSIDTNDLLLLSLSQLQQNSSEAEYRSAISRSYYSVYHETIETADVLGLPEKSTSNKGVHARLFDRFDISGKNELKKIAGKLYNLKRKRVQADYEIKSNISILEAKKHVKSCEFLIKDLVNLRS